MSLGGIRRGLVVAYVAVAVVAIGGAALHGALPAWSLAVGITVLVVGTSWALAPAAVTIDGATLNLERNVGTILAVPLPAISDVELVPRLRLAFLLDGGRNLFGTHTLGWSRALGWVRVYATQGGPGVLLRRRDALPVFVTPDDPERFFTELRAACAPFGVLAPR